MKRLPRRAEMQLRKARESAILAVEIYNKPATQFKSGGYIVLMIIAWTALFHAVFWNRRRKPFYRDPKNRRRYLPIDGDFKCWELDECLRQYFGSNTQNALRKNLEFFIPLRNQIEHRFMPELDAAIFGECQAMLLNFDEIVEKEFNSRHCLRESLSFSLQMFPSSATLADAITKNGQNKSIADFISCYRSSVGSDIQNDGKFSFRAFLIQVANNVRAHALPIQFIRAQDLSDEEKQSLENLTTVLVKQKKVSVHNADLIRPSEVLKRVQAGLGNPFKVSGKRKIPWFTINVHAACVKRHKIRPAKGDSQPEDTRSEYCIFDEPHKDYLYTQAWVDLLIAEQSLLVSGSVAS